MLCQVWKGSNSQVSIASFLHLIQNALNRSTITVASSFCSPACYAVYIFTDPCWYTGLREIMAPILSESPTLADACTPMRRALHFMVGEQLQGSFQGRRTFAPLIPPLERLVCLFFRIMSFPGGWGGKGCKGNYSHLRVESQYVDDALFSHAKQLL